MINFYWLSQPSKFVSICTLQIIYKSIIPSCGIQGKEKKIKAQVEYKSALIFLMPLGVDNLEFSIQLKSGQ